MLDLCQCIGNLNMELVTNGKLSYWVSTCHFYQGRKTLTVDKLEHLKSQLDLTTYGDLISQLEELILKLEPLDSACSSRRSSISSHVSIHTFKGFCCIVRRSPLGCSHLFPGSQNLASFQCLYWRGGSGCQEGAFFQLLDSSLKHFFVCVLELHSVLSLFIICCLKMYIM